MVPGEISKSSHAEDHGAGTVLRQRVGGDFHGYIRPAPFHQEGEQCLQIRGHGRGQMRRGAQVRNFCFHGSHQPGGTIQRGKQAVQEVRRRRFSIGAGHRETAQAFGGFPVDAGRNGTQVRGRVLHHEERKLHPGLRDQSSPGGVGEDGACAPLRRLGGKARSVSVGAGQRGEKRPLRHRARIGGHGSHGGLRGLATGTIHLGELGKLAQRHRTHLRKREFVTH